MCFVLSIVPSLLRAAVQDFGRNYSFALTTETDEFALNLSPSDHQSINSVQYRPNLLPLNGFQVSVGGLTLAYQTTVARNPENDRKKGVTSYEDIRGALALGDRSQWLLVGYYNRYGGLFIENSSLLDPSYVAGESYLQRSDISVFNSGLGALYVFSPERFSIAASVLQSAKQTESAGSFIALVGFDGTLFTAGAPLVPSIVRSDFGQDGNLSEGKFTTVSVSGGYGYTFTKYSFFFTLMGLVGPGYQWRQYKVSDEEYSSTVNASKFTVGAALGYNGDSFFAGGSFVSNSTEYATKTVRIRTQLNSARFFVGLRF